MKLKKVLSKKLLSITLCLTLGTSITGCSLGSDSASKDYKKIVVGAMQVPGGELFEHLKSDIEK